jgi:hypothetical protein
VHKKQKRNAPPVNSDERGVIEIDLSSPAPMPAVPAMAPPLDLAAPAPAAATTKFCIESGLACGPMPFRAKFCPTCGAGQQ